MGVQLKQESLWLSQTGEATAATTSSPLHREEAGRAARDQHGRQMAGTWQGTQGTGGAGFGSVFSQTCVATN